MSSDRVRRQIAWEAARLICHHEEPEYFRARWKAALRVAGPGVRPGDLPGSREIDEEVNRLEQSLRRDVGEAAACRHGDFERDRFRIYETLLAPLEKVRENPKSHPEGDVLYHSLQVFELARQQIPYDEEFLLSALLHDVGKAIDPKEHVEAGLAALDGSITPRTAWFIEHHLEALALQEGRLGVRCIRRLNSAEDFSELMLLADCDRRGRARGVQVPDVIEALDYVRQLDEMCGE
jgi:predicted HD phosphohydrolase